MAWIATACQVFVRCPRFSVSGRCPPFRVSVRYSRLGVSSRQPKGWTPNARFLDSQNRIIPSFPVIQNGILAPRLFSKLPSHFGEVFLSAGERPVLPPLHVAVVHRIIVDVIHRRPEMRVVAHITLRRAVLSEVVPVLEAASGDVVARLLAGAMGRTMPGQTLAFAPGHQAFALLWRQLAPEIGWSAHTRSVFT